MYRYQLLLTNNKSSYNILITSYSTTLETHVLLQHAIYRSPMWPIMLNYSPTCEPPVVI